MKPIRLATRTSPLAMWQAETVRDRLLAGTEGLAVEIVPVRTKGDRDTSTSLGSMSATGIFTKEVDREILEGRADIAVHSLKDQETTLHDGLLLGMVLERGPIEDCLVSPAGWTLADLPEGARVATGSLRRRAQLLASRPDLQLVDIRGNVDTRLQRLEAGAGDALVMARAGLVRLGYEERISDVIPADVLLPAPSQGIVGVTCRAEATDVVGLLAACDHAPTRAAAEAERALLRRLEGGCNVPVGALATCADGGLDVRARVLSLDGKRRVEAARVGSAAEAARLGVEVADALLAEGASGLVAEARQ